MSVKGAHGGGRAFLAGAALLVCLAGGTAEAQQCKPKTAGYFTRMPAFARTKPATELAGLAEPLGGVLGHPGRGSEIIREPEKGACLACHRVPGLGGEGDLGPNLAGAGQRYTQAQLRQIVVDPHVLFPDSLMPAYHKPADYPRLPTNAAGSTILSAQDVEDVVAFLNNLK